MAEDWFYPVPEEDVSGNIKGVIVEQRRSDWEPIYLWGGVLLDDSKAHEDNPIFVRQGEYEYRSDISAQRLRNQYPAELSDLEQRLEEKNKELQWD